MNVLKIVGIALCVLVGWWVINLTVAYWWATTTAATEPMGTAEFFLREVLRNVPAIGYFLLAGALLALAMGVTTGAASALLAAITNVCINVALGTHTFVSISYFDVAILLINYGLPVAAAAVGAMLIHLKGKRTLVET
jgi:hypothetical protein